MLLPAEAMNQFTASGLILVVTGAVMAYAHQVPATIWHWFKNQTTVSINVKDDDPAFEWTKEWLARQEFLSKVRRVDLDSSIRGKQLTMMPAPGSHLFWRNGRPFWLEFIRSDEAKGQWEAKRAETLRFSTIGRRRSLLEGFVEEIISSHKESLNIESEAYTWNDWWGKQKSYSPRRLEAVILPGTDKERIVRDIQQFLNSKEYYAKLGIPYHRGYAFYGPPGTGKTSLASALGREFGMSVYIVNLSDLNDKSLKQAISRVPERSIILFEDIDASGASKKRVDKSQANVNTGTTKTDSSMNEVFGVSLSGFLNVLDGFYAPDGVLFFMTTNHIDNLDPALLRPGRIDYKLYMGQATEQQKIALYKRFFPETLLAEAEEFVRQRPSTETMAEFQGLLLTKRN